MAACSRKIAKRDLAATTPNLQTPCSVMRTQTILLAVVVALGAVVVMAQQYPGCKTDAQCQSTGDKGGYCKPNGFCHCSFPAYNNTFWGYCLPELCFTDAQCQSGGDSSAHCDQTTHFCSCTGRYANAPSPAYCLFPSCTSDADCRANGDAGAYCQDNGACHCDVQNNYAQYPSNAYCQIPPWVTK